jgi:hypothetical protein
VDKKEEINMEEVKEKKQVYNAVQVPIQHALAIETPSGEILTIENALAEILNRLAEIKRLLG